MPSFARAFPVSLFLGLTLFLAACGTTPPETALPIEEPLPTLEPTPPAESKPVDEMPISTETTAPATEAPAAVASGVSFKNDILPIFEKSCVRCHGGTRNEEGLSIHTYAALMTGSENGPVILPGDAENSELVAQIESGEMPRRAPKLEAEKIQLIIDWVNQGALDN